MYQKALIQSVENRSSPYDHNYSEALYKEFIKTGELIYNNNSCSDDTRTAIKGLIKFISSNSMDKKIIDIKGEEILSLGFKNSPAGSGNHHSYYGGLLTHLLEMWNISIDLENVIKNNLYLTEEGERNWDSYFNQADIFLLIVLHDLHKGYHTFSSEGITLNSINRGVPFKYIESMSSDSFTNSMLSLALPLSEGIKIPLRIIQAYQHSEGGWSDMKPRQTSVLGKYAYLLDEISGNIISRINSGSTDFLRTTLKPDSTYGIPN